MKMSDLANVLQATIKVAGDREVTFIDESTGEIRYVEAVSFDSTGECIMLEHIDYQEKKLADQLALFDNLTEEQKVLFANAVLENLMEEIWG